MITPEQIEAAAAEIEDGIEEMGYHIKGHILRRILKETVEEINANPNDEGHEKELAE